MTEAEWNACADSAMMLRFFRGRVGYRIAPLCGSECSNSMRDLLCGDAFTQLAIASATDNEAQRCELIREIFRYPAHPLPELDPAWLAWADGTLRRLAAGEGPYRDYHFAILADALEESGCTDEAILDHLRCDHALVRGCWAVDWILGRT